MAPKKAMKKGLEKSKMKVLKLGMKAKAKASSTAAAKKEKGSNKTNLGQEGCKKPSSNKTWAAAKKDLEKPRAKNKLNKTNLEKLGNMSPKDKIKAAAEQGEDLGQQAKILKKSLTPDENSQIWGKRKTYLKHAFDLEKLDHESLGKKEKGMAAAKRLMEREGKKYTSCTKAVKAQELWKKHDQWQTKKQMLQKFTFLSCICSLVEWCGKRSPGLGALTSTRTWRTGPKKSLPKGPRSGNKVMSLNMTRRAWKSSQNSTTKMQCILVWGA